MGSSADGVVDLAGLLSLASAFLTGSPIPLSQTISGVYNISMPIRIAAGDVYVDVPLPFSPGVTEALFMCIVSAKPVDVEETTASDTPGPLMRGLKGVGLWTYMPDKGLTALRIKNTNMLEDATVMLAVATTPIAGEIPAYFA